MFERTALPLGDEAAANVRWELRLAGPLRLVASDGSDLTPTPKRAQALLALLGAAPGHRRPRSWLQDKLWSGSGTVQGSANMRQMLLRLRRALGDARGALVSKSDWMGLDPHQVRVVLDPFEAGWSGYGEPPEFCEGLYVDDPEFEDWVRDQRQAVAAMIEADDGGEARRRKPASGGGPARTSALPRLLVVIAVRAPGDRRRLAQPLAEEIVAACGAYQDIALVSPTLDPAVVPDPDLRTFAQREQADYLAVLRPSVATPPQITVQLVEARGMTICWLARHLLPHPDDVSGAIELAASVADELAGRNGVIVGLERDRLRRDAGACFDAHELYLRAGDGLDVDDRGSAIAALALAERCTKLEPRFGRGWLMLGWRRNHVLSYRWAVESRDWLAEEQAMFRRAVDLAPRDPLALGFLALSRAKQGAGSEARRLVARAAELAMGRDDDAVELSLGLSAIAGEGRRALDLIKRALDRRSSPPPHWAYMETRAAFFAGEHERALAASDAAPDCLPKHVYRALAAAELGETSEAADCLRRLAALRPDFGFGWYARNQGLVHPEAVARYRSALARIAPLATR